MKKTDYEASKDLQKAMRTSSANSKLLYETGLIKMKTSYEKEGRILLAKAMQSDPYQARCLREEAKVYLADV